MSSGVRARVIAGRIVVDEPSELPDGTELTLVIDDGGDELDESERDALHESIERGIDDVAAGRTVPAAEVLAQLRKRS